jgi:serine/threonine-protein kinase
MTPAKTTSDSRAIDSPPCPYEDVTGTRNATTDDTQVIANPASRDTTVIEVPSRPVQPMPGDRIGPYMLQSHLGTGVSCHVFRAWDESKSCPVAVKIINWGNVYDYKAALKQMRTEAAALARVKHPRVLRFIDFGFDPRWPYLVTEFVEGRPLGEVIRNGGVLPIEWTMHLMNQVVDGLGAVWKAGIVHRDIKPDNILIGASGVAKLIDFGVAKVDILRALESASNPEMAGTAAYLAPEQARNSGTVDCRADIYSFGVTFYEALTGKLPFEARNRMQMVFQHLNAPPTPPAVLVPEIPSLASDLCLWMLAKSPGERPQNYVELREGFNTVIAAMVQK